MAVERQHEAARDSKCRASAVSLATTETVEDTAPGSGNLTGGRGGVRNQRAQGGPNAALLGGCAGVPPDRSIGQGWGGAFDRVTSRYRLDLLLVRLPRAQRVAVAASSQQAFDSHFLAV